MKTTKFILWTIIFVCFSITATAQDKKPQACTVTGQIVNQETGEPVPYATIGFSQMPAYIKVLYVTVADENGHFSYSVPQGTYDLQISSIGYSSQMLFNKDATKATLEVGKIKLSSKAEELPMVVVEPMVQITSSEITYNLAQDPDREKMNLHEILDKVPMVDITPDGKLYVNEPGSTFLVVRNGKKDVLFDNPDMLDQTLRTLPAKAFEKVTVKLMPESRYGNYRYVLSIDADKTNRLFGAINNHQDSYNTNDGKLDIGTAVLASYDRLRMQVGGSFSNTNSPRSKQTLEQRFHDDGSQLRQEGKTHQNGETFSAGGAFSYDIAPRHFVTSRFSYGNNRSRNYENLSVNRQDANGTSAYTSRSMDRNTGYSLSGSVNYQYDFAKPKRVLNVVYDVSHQSGKQDNDYRFEGTYDPDIIPPYLQGNSLSRQHTVQAHYCDPLSGKWTLESGLGYIYRDYNSLSDYYDQDRQEMASQRYEMESRKHLFNAYLNLRYQSKRVSGQVKLKGEYLDDGRGTLIAQGTDAPEHISQSGFFLTPQADLSFLLKKERWINYINLFYQWNKYRPGLSVLTTRIDYANPNMLTTGNPRLDDEDIHVLGIRLQVPKGPNITITGDYSGNRISPYWYKDEQDRVVQTYNNDGTYHGISLSTNYTLVFKKLWLAFMWSESYHYSRTADRQRTERLDSHISVQTTLTVARNGSIGLLAGYMDTHSSGMEHMDTRPFSFMINTNWKFFKKRLEAELRISDLAGFRSKSRHEVHTAEFDQTLVTRSHMLPVELKLRWTLGNFKVKPVRQARRGAVIDDIKPE